jgi:hypothetical protein
MEKRIFFLFFFAGNFFYSFSQENGLQDSSHLNTVSEARVKPVLPEMRYDIGDNKVLVYPKPRPFGFIRNLPGDAKGIVKSTFNKKALKPLAIIAGSTAVLMLADQSITDEVQRFMTRAHISSSTEFKNVASFKMGKQSVNVLRVPQNLNTAFYEAGQGFPGLLIGAGLFTYGKIKHDYRSLSTASQLAESFILMGVATQIIKRISGRESPSEATARGGAWHPFPSFHDFQNNTAKYDAFPSGHMATLISTITILAENYPEHKYIKYIGYPLSGLIGIAMINNGAHWAGDYPLAVGLGYLCAKEVAKVNRRLESQSASGKRKTELNWSVNYQNGRILPAVVCRF